ncbi:hypothetical protein V1477_005039 [Vespula maculifrons]|uniref:Uncharacterized protein n=1 Tax=Vespula maculifrons TaxID=7453 RepID=A0ABD2CPM8_VESMC
MFLKSINIVIYKKGDVCDFCTLYVHILYPTKVIKNYLANKILSSCILVISELKNKRKSACNLLPLSSMSHLTCDTLGNVEAIDFGNSDRILSGS